MSPEVKMKRCKPCGGRFPATEEFFAKDVHRRDGLHSYCRNCHRSNSKVSYLRRCKPSYSLARLFREDFFPDCEVPRGYRKCSNPFCHRVRQANAYWFSVDLRVEGGLSGECRACALVRAKMSRENKVVNAEVEVEAETVEEIALREMCIGKPGYDEEGYPL